MKKNILFVFTNYSTFVKTDFEILASEHKVIKLQFKPVNGLLKNTIQVLKQIFYLLFNFWKFDVVYIWFADYHSFFPVLFAKIFGKKSLVVIGGYDVANMPGLRYGSLASPLRKAMTVFTFKNASLCLPVVEALEKKLKEVSPAARTKTIHTGYAFFDNSSPRFGKERDKMVLTVSVTSNYQRLQVKGLDRFRELAEFMPGFQFVIVGATESSKALFDPLPENLILTPPLHQQELSAYYQKASFYAQFSRSEGLPNALCEGMLYGCIPIGMNIGGIPEAIGDLGLVMDRWDPRIAADYILKNHNKANREVFRSRIIKKFDLSFRKEKLLSEIS